MSGPERTMVPKVRTPATNLLRFLFLALSTLASLSQAQLEVHIPAGLTKLQALEGSEALLPAWYVTTASKLEDWGSPLLFWFLEQKGKKDQKQILAYINGALTRSPRASLAYSMPSQNVSLLLQALEEKDSGTYRVSVDVQDSQGKNHHSTKTIELDVLVPPTPPSCNLRGVPRVGTNMTLTCHSSRSKPEVLYQWERLTPSSQIFFAPALDAAAGSLKLTNLSTSMSGVYVCKASNVVGTVQCNVTLEVITGPSVGVVAGAIVGSLVGLVLLVGLVFLYQRRKKVLEDVSNDIKEDAFAPRTLPWTKSIDTISKNGTLSSVTSSRTLQPSHASPKPGTLSSTPSLSRQVQSLPKMPTIDGPQPQPGYQNLDGVSPNNLIRKGAVPVMVPAQNKIGSLV